MSDSQLTEKNEFILILDDEIYKYDGIYEDWGIGFECTPITFATNHDTILCEKLDSKIWRVGAWRLLEDGTHSGFKSFYKYGEWALAEDGETTVLKVWDRLA